MVDKSKVLRAFVVAAVGMYYLTPIPLANAPECRDFCQLISALVFDNQPEPFQTSIVLQYVIKAHEASASIAAENKQDD
jgi:hypothetical protein